MTEESTIIDSTVTENTTQEKVRVEEFEISGASLMDKIKEWVNQANVRRITIKKESGGTLLEIPLAYGAAGVMVGLVLAPYLVAIAAIAALVVKVKVVVERIED